MKSLKLTVKGIVQKVGYRNTVYRAARKLKIKGYVKNLDDPDESVEIVIQHPDDRVLEEFISKIKINDGFIEVQEIVKEEKKEKEYPKFEVVRGSYEEENAERLDVAEMALKNLTKAVVTGNKELGEKLDKGNKNLGEKMDKMNENLGEKMDGMNKNLSGKMDKMNENLGGKMDRMSDNLDGFANSVSTRFDVVDTKYGKISEKLEKLDGIDDSLKELVSILRAFKPKE